MPLQRLSYPHSAPHSRTRSPQPDAQAPTAARSPAPPPSTGPARRRAPAPPPAPRRVARGGTRSEGAGTSATCGPPSAAGLPSPAHTPAESNRLAGSAKQAPACGDRAEPPGVHERSERGGEDGEHGAEARAVPGPGRSGPRALRIPTFAPGPVRRAAAPRPGPWVCVRVSARSGDAVRGPVLTPGGLEGRLVGGSMNRPRTPPASRMNPGTRFAPALSRGAPRGSRRRVLFRPSDPRPGVVADYLWRGETGYFVTRSQFWLGDLLPCPPLCWVLCYPASPPPPI